MIRYTQLVHIKRFIVFVFIGLLLSNCSKNDSVRFIRNRKDCKNCDVLQSEIKVKLKQGVYKFDCSNFMNSVLVKELSLDSKFQKEDFDYMPLRLDSKFQITEARTIFKDITYYLYFDKNLGVIYASRFHPYEIDEFSLIEHPFLDQSELLEIIDKCKEHNQNVLNHIYD